MTDNILVVGYGTFIVHALQTLKPDGTAQQWQWDVKVLGLSKLRYWKRIIPASLGYPILIPGRKTDVLDVLVVETDEGNLEAIDRVEGHPNLYKRHNINTRFGLAFIYLPTNKIYKSLTDEDLARGDTWPERIKLIQNPIARGRFPVFFPRQGIRLNEKVLVTSGTLVE